MKRIWLSLLLLFPALEAHAQKPTYSLFSRDLLDNVPVDLLSQDVYAVTPKIAFGDAGTFTLVGPSNPLPIRCVSGCGGGGGGGTVDQGVQGDSGSPWFVLDQASLAKLTTISGQLSGSIAVTGPLTDAQLRASAVPVVATAQTDGTQKTQIVDGSGNVVSPVVSFGGLNFLPTYNLANGLESNATSGALMIMGGKDGGDTLRTLSVASDGSVNANLLGGSVTANAGTDLNTSALALESGGHLASVDTKLSTINTTLGSPFQSGGSIGNTAFGISGTLPAYAATPTFNLGTLGGAATAANQVTAQTSLTSMDSTLTTIKTSLADENVTGTISALNAAVTIPITGHATVYFNVTGTFVATLIFEADAGDGVWNNVAAINQNNGIFFFVTVPGVNFLVPVGGFDNFRVRAETYTSGTVNITMNAGQGPNVLEMFQPVATALNATVVGTGGAALALDSSVTSLTVSQGSTTSGEKGSLVQGAVSTDVPAYTNGHTSPLSLSLRGGLRSKVIGLDPALIVRNDYASVNVTTGAYVQLTASTSVAANRLQIFDSSGQDFVLATGGAGSEVDQIQIPPGGWDSPVDLYIPSGTRLSIKSKSATASSGILLITGLK